jgi:hypothetical protein
METIAQIIGGEQSTALKTTLHALAGQLEAMGLCNDERQWLQDPTAARALKSQAARNDSAFGKEEKRKIKKMNDEEKENGYLHRTAAAAVGYANNNNNNNYGNNNFKRWFTPHGGQAYRGRGFGFYRGAGRGLSPATATRGGFYSNSNTGWGQARSRGASTMRGGSSSRGRAGTRGRGGRGGRV